MFRFSCFSNVITWSSILRWSDLEAIELMRVGVTLRVIDDSHRKVGGSTTMEEHDSLTFTSAVSCMNIATTKTSREKTVESLLSRTTADDVPSSIANNKFRQRYLKLLFTLAEQGENKIREDSEEVAAFRTSLRETRHKQVRCEH
ncbi:unnamed protein product [Soboliphyme baturini]|uniref:Uncharacterized protein n=1 Tax=Soboliphyme baturini TaxID=241478 RepID=A0A183IJ32_9BILA|nr:unnamed protein product [Soboliphyme baturini]